MATVSAKPSVVIASIAATTKLAKDASLDEILSKYRQEDRQRQSHVDLTEQEIEAQKLSIMRDLAMASHDYTKGPHEHHAKATKALISSLETEVGNLVRQSAKVEDLGKLTKGPLASRGSHVIFASAAGKVERTPNQLVNYEDVVEPQQQDSLANFAYEDLDELRMQHAAKLKILEEEYQRKKREESTIQATGKIADKYGFRRSTAGSKDAMNYPTYGRGKDPDPEFKSYMFNAGLLGPSKSVSPVKRERKRTSIVASEKAGKKPKVMSPERQQYEAKFQRYEEIKANRTESEESRRWVRYGRGPNDPGPKFLKFRERFSEHLMGFVPKKAATPVKREERKSLLHPGEPHEEETLLPLTQKQKQSFLLLRDFYNSLDQDGTNSVEKQRILDELTINEAVRRKFLVDRIAEFDQELRCFPTQKDGFISWQEFLDLIFRHKRVMKQPAEVPEEELLLKAPDLGKKEEPKALAVPSAPVSRPKSARKAEAEKEDFHVTVPQPFRFFDRERFRGKSIRQRKLEEMLEEKRLAEEKLVNTRFKANPIPQSTTLPRFEQMKKAQEDRTADVKKASYEMTKAREKPFSFYERDRDFYVARAKAADENVPEVMKNIKPFKANPIPAAVTAMMMEGLQEKEDKIREERTRKWAQELKDMSKLPPRMALHEAEKLQQSNGTQPRPVPSGMQYTYEPPRARPVPDFARQQRTFQLALEHHKQQRQPTVIKPFNFRETKKTANIREFMDLENQPRVETRPKSSSQGRIASLSKPSINPPTTAKTIKAMEVKRRKLEERRINEQKRMAEDQARKDKLKKLAPEVQAIIHDNREQLKRQTEEKLRRARELVAQQEQEWNERKQEIAENVRRRPLLMQEPSPGRIREIEEDEEELEDQDNEEAMENVLEEAELRREEGQEQAEAEEQEDESDEGERVREQVTAQ